MVSVYKTIVKIKQNNVSKSVLRMQNAASMNIKLRNVGMPS